MLPDFSAMEPAVRAQMEGRAATLRSRLAAGAPATDLAMAYGEMGMLLHAATQFDAAQSCYLNAQALAPQDRRWPYYLAHVQRITGALDRAVASFEAALRLDPSDVAAMVWLGDVDLALGRAEAADALFARALARLRDSAAAHAGAGRAALARKDFPRAVDELTRALAIEPGATAVHYPLAMAYRGLGDLTRAEAHLEQQGTIDARPSDPLMQALDMLLESAESYNVRGGRALDAGDFAAAAESFHKGLTLSPGDTSLRHRLGTALAQMGDTRGAIEQFEQVIQTLPSHARAHFSLGVILSDAGRNPEAIEHLSKAIQYEPGYVESHVQLAGVLARSGRAQEALPPFREALALDPRHAGAAFGYAMALVRLHRYREARDRLAEGAKAFPAQPSFRHALARLLAAAPDENVRDVGRAKALLDEVLKEEQTIELGETAAMILADLGGFAEAAAVQRDLIAAAERAGQKDVVRRLATNLKRYERREPCRTPFTEAELP
jgi:tetratricopeptide (TPR) repeat protein